MDDSWKSLSYSELKVHNRDVGTLLAERRQEELENLRAKLAELGLSAEDVAVKRGNGRPAPKYRHPDTGETWSGRGKRPNWLSDALTEGRELDDFVLS